MDDGFDAAFIGLGLPETVCSSTSKLEGLTDAMDFLERAKNNEAMDLAGKRVAVIGGGNTAIDVATTAQKHGAMDVFIIYRRSFEQIPAWPEEVNNALNSGVHFMILTQQLSYNSQNGQLAGIRVCPVYLGENDNSNRRRPVPMEDSAYNIDIDYVIEAIGQKAVANLDSLLPQVQLDNGLIKIRQGSFETTRPRVYAGGDIVRGASTVVAAVADGMKAAKEIDTLLKKEICDGK
jgi:glutamate synthase (NADPH/NADH) small chain